MNSDILLKAANQARGLALDAIAKAKSGHLGLPLGAAEIGAVLFAETMQFNPAEPRWINRDRFVLSGGHGSMFLYAWLHLSGYDLSLDEIISFRQKGSKTPGHPEFGETVGVECTTGPLGQGIGNAVGMALAGKMAAKTFNTDDCTLFDYHIYTLAGDGCIQEGISAEAASFAGHLGLDNLIIIYDSNDVTLDAMADATQSEDTAKRYESYGFDVVTIDGHDLEAIRKAMAEAKAADNGKPKMIIAKTEIARGIPQVAGCAKGHGEGGIKFRDEALIGMGLPTDGFTITKEIREAFAARKTEKEAACKIWETAFESWSKANPEKAKRLTEGINKSVPSDLLDRIPVFEEDAKLATRKAGSIVLQPIAEAIPTLISGSADLHGSTLNYIQGSGYVSKKTPSERNIRFGIREHAMGAIMNGIAYDGIYRPSGATFSVFSDYMRGSIRLAALAKLPLFYIFTHDSVGVGEDGPTHQPVEIVSALRCYPDLDVIRPADPEETAAAFAQALINTDNPTALILTRQAVPNLNEIPVVTRRRGTLKGGYVAKEETGELKAILLASGSEVQHAMVAAEKLGDGIRVVSIPCFEIFDRQDAAYRESVLPSSCRKRVAIEAGISTMWYKYIGLDGKAIGIDRFGFSAPGDKVMKDMGICPDSVIDTVNSIL